jgi:hypothetical protein
MRGTRITAARVRQINRAFAAISYRFLR